MARPEKLTPEVQQKIVDAIRLGNYIETAAAYAGISKSTLYDWLKKGGRARSGKYREFSDAVEKALAESEMRDVAVITAAAKENWQAAAWRLERKFPDRWGRRERIDANLNHQGQVTQRHEYHIVQQIVQNDPERLEAIRGIFRGLNRRGISPDPGGMEGGREE